MKVPVGALVGPTAAGKTALSLEIAEQLGAEIVSVDSMQIYRGMDIGTAKATAVERERVPHHLIDLRDPGHELTVAEYQELGRAAIEEISARGASPLLVGGSGLYLRAIVDDLRFPPTAPEVRARLESEAGEEGAGVLFERLRAVDPDAASKIEPGNRRRIVRALEVIEVTGRRFSEFGTAWESYESRYDLRIVGLSHPRETLYERIAARVDEMFEQGFLEEVERLRSASPGRTAGQALGYRQVLEAPPDADPAALKQDIVRATKRFARRQESWFRADPRIEWIEAGPSAPAGALAVIGP